MENFGIFCLFAILMVAVIGIPYLLVKIFNSNNHDSYGIAILILFLLGAEAGILYYLYWVFHHGLWMILRGR